MLLLNQNTDSAVALINAAFGYSNEGKAAIFHCYFDDSGTHKNAPFVVWGGIFGRPAEIEKLTRLWNDILREPIEGKPPISKMHMASLCASQKEFSSYLPAERDLLRKRCRDAIHECDLAAVAFIVNVNDWEEISTPIEKQFLGNAGNFAYSGALDIAAKLSKVENCQVAVFFDKGARSMQTNTVHTAWDLMKADLLKDCSFAYVPVASFAALQAADLIAYEAYQYSFFLSKRHNAPESPHFVRLREKMNVGFFFFEEIEIKQHLEKWRAAMKPLIDLASSFDQMG